MEPVARVQPELKAIRGTIRAHLRGERIAHMMTPRMVMATRGVSRNRCCGAKPTMLESTHIAYAIKGRIYPTRQQAETLANMRYALACIRERVKAEVREYYETHGQGCPRDWPQKAIAQPMHRALGMPCDALSVVNVVATVRRSYVNWWRRPDHFKPPAKRHPERFPAGIYVHNQRFEHDGGRVRLLGNKVGWMRWRAGRAIPDGAKVNSGRVSCVAGRWYLSVSLEADSAPSDYAAPSDRAVGIDPGIRAQTMVGDSRAVTEFPRQPERSKKRRRRLDRKLSRCQRGSRRHRRLRKAKARSTQSEALRRQDAIHKATRRIVETGAVIGIETPSAKRWQQSGIFGEASREAIVGEMVRQIRYKAEWAGRTVVEVPETAGSTRTCHVCGAVTPHRLGLKRFRCDHCGHTDGRDINAACNVRRHAIEGAGAQRPETPVGVRKARRRERGTSGQRLAAGAGGAPR